MNSEVYVWFVFIFMVYCDLIRGTGNENVAKFQLSYSPADIVVKLKIISKLCAMFSFIGANGKCDCTTNGRTVQVDCKYFCTHNSLLFLCIRRVSHVFRA